MSEKTMSSYMQYIPEIYQEDDFLGQYLKIFEKVLSGIEDEIIYKDGIEEVLDIIHEYFDPQKAPDYFLKWLANWVALDLNEKWSDSMVREVINKIVPLYKKRGTVEGLKEFLSWDDYVKEDGISILEWLEPILIKDGTTLEDGLVLNETMMIGGGYQDYFKVKAAIDRNKLPDEIKTAVEQYILDYNLANEIDIEYNTMESEKFDEIIEVVNLLDERKEILNIIIEDEKPAHTIHKLEIYVD